MAFQIRKVLRIPEAPKRVRVAAYARVSVTKGNTPQSLSTQVSHYNQLISSRKDWEMVGVFSDAGVSGTKLQREGFQQLLQACEEKKVDLVLTKSISRFARNTVDLLSTVRHLKEIGVEVYFERERISTFTGDGELMLSILASFAQEEAQSVSQNVKWGIKRDFLRGKTNQMCVYGYIWTGEEFIINEEQATIIKEVFRRYLDGEIISAIVRDLNERKVPTYWNKAWSYAMIRNILYQERYTGNTLFQKTFNAYPGDHGTKNIGQMPQYWAENTHPAIIDMDTFKRAGALFEKNRQINIAKRNSVGRRTKTVYALSGKIRCTVCGSSYIRGSSTGKSKSSRYVCGSWKNPGTYPKDMKHGHTVIDDIMLAHCAYVLDLNQVDETLIRQKIKEIRVGTERTFEIELTDGTVFKRHWQTGTKHRSHEERIKDILEGKEGESR